MKSCLLIFLFTISTLVSIARQADSSLITPFERSSGLQTATYEQAMLFYKQLSTRYATIAEGDAGPTDNGYPLRYVCYTKSGDFDKGHWKRDGKIVILINNDIHPGEPDGVDACMMLLRDVARGKINVAKNIVLVIIPIYNIGGALNRNSYSRANQNGPESYGFRGNARNLDLNRDFIKCDANETIAFEGLFTQLDPDLFIDNHVSDGADYQHIMTLLATQHDKLGGETGAYMYNIFTPMVYRDMKEKGYDLVPYVNDFDKTPEAGWKEFYEPPCFSSGYAALFHTMAYVPETHMLKPFKDRVYATYALLETFIKLGSANSKTIKNLRAADLSALRAQKEFVLDWKADTTRCDSVLFEGYEAGYKTSDISKLPRLYYDHSKPYMRKVPFYNHYIPARTATAPKAYIIPKAWVPVITCLRNNGVHVLRLGYDTIIAVTAYHIDSYESVARPYEKHYLHKNVQITPNEIKMHFAEGDYIVWTDQPGKRYVIETLEPTAPDAFFAWNFFDGVLQEKEYFSSYVFEDIAANMLNKDTSLKKLLEDRKKEDPAFAKDAEAQLDFVYKHSSYFEPSFMRYPVYWVE